MIIYLKEVFVMIKTKKQGLLIVVSGPSGCGKSTLDNLILKKRQNI